ncbi:MAG: carboxymuconolactone decarboxylase family protein [Acidobacteriota bacterium]
MEYAEAMTETPPAVDDELVQRLRAHVDEAQLVELTAIICLENVRSRFNSAIGLPPSGIQRALRGPGIAARLSVPGVHDYRSISGSLEFLL